MKDYILEAYGSNYEGKEQIMESESNAIRSKK